MEDENCSWGVTETVPPRGRTTAETEAAAAARRPREELKEGILLLVKERIG
jgi:hypothetical protein